MHIGLFCPPDGPGPVGRGSPGLSADPDQNGCTGHRATRGDGIACAIYGFASRWAFAGPAVSTGSTVLDRGIVISISSTCRVGVFAFSGMRQMLSQRLQRYVQPSMLNASVVRPRQKRATGLTTCRRVEACARFHRFNQKAFARGGAHSGQPVRHGLERHLPGAESTAKLVTSRQPHHQGPGAEADRHRKVGCPPRQPHRQAQTG